MKHLKFWKMSGSGNDFVFVDARADRSLGSTWSSPDFVRQVCAPHTGVGADGVAIIELDATQDFRLRYFNRDGSVGELCGNASLCATRLAVELGVAPPDRMTFQTDAGVISARIRDGAPEIDLQPPTGLAPESGIPRQDDEARLGFVDSGVPHLVIRTTALDAIPVSARGPELRHHPSLKAGANVNWVAPASGGGWAMRTYERGVEAETLACGTGAVACAVLLQAWGETGSQTAIRTRSGRILTVTSRRDGDRLLPSLSGEGRIVFEGLLREM